MTDAPTGGQDDKPINCAGCQVNIGMDTVVNGKHYARLGPILAHSIHGVCVHCGFPYHWASTDRQLDDLIQRVIVKR